MRDEAAGFLLAWYDRAARILPWRMPPGSGHPADPYHVWLSEVMLQQTVVVTVIPYFERFTARWPDVLALAAAEETDVLGQWAGLGYYARARNLIRCARMVADRGGQFPRSEDELRTLPGIGPYTAAAIAAIAYDQPAVVVDGNVERVMSRLFAVEDTLPQARGLLRNHATELTPRTRAGDYAQAVMDLGATVCTPRTPRCSACPIASFCRARSAGQPGRYPRRAPRGAKSQRQGIAYLARRADGRVLLERRPDAGLLGGMLGLPGTSWTEEIPKPAPPLAARWRSAGEIHHVFTHFRLKLTVMVADLPGSEAALDAGFQPVDGETLPRVMRKALDLGLAVLEQEG